jgi:hypothetical protein
MMGDGWFPSVTVVAIALVKPGAGELWQPRLAAQSPKLVGRCELVRRV